MDHPDTIDELRDAVMARESEICRLRAAYDDLVRGGVDAMYGISFRKDAERYRALKERHAYVIVTRLIEWSNGYNSATAPGLIDAYADAAVFDVRRFAAMTDEERQAERKARIEELARQLDAEARG